MTILRRLLLVIMVFVVPLVMTQLLYMGTIFLLEYFERVINPMALRYAAIGEFTLIFVICLLEARERW